MSDGGCSVAVSVAGSRPVYDLNLYSMEEINWDNQLSVDPVLFANYLPNIPSQGIIDIRLSERFNSNTSLISGLAEQARLTIEAITNSTNGKVAIIAHGIVGNALQKLIDDSIIDESTVVGLMKLNSPQDIESTDLLHNEKLRRGVHLLSLIENVELELHESLTTNGLNREIYFSRSELLQTVRKVSETITRYDKVI